MNKEKIINVLIGAIVVFIICPFIFQFAWNLGIASNFDYENLNYIQALKLWAGLSLIKISLLGFKAGHNE